jgi:hypothetical protein
VLCFTTLYCYVNEHDHEEGARPAFKFPLDGVALSLESDDAGSMSRLRLSRGAKSLHLAAAVGVSRPRLADAVVLASLGL